MAEKKSKNAPEEEPEIVFTPSASLETATQGDVETEEREAPADGIEKTGIEAPADGSQHELIADQTRYRVTAGGISTATGAHYRGEALDAAQIGDDARVRHLLAKRAIEAI